MFPHVQMQAGSKGAQRASSQGNSASKQHNTPSDPRPSMEASKDMHHVPASPEHASSPSASQTEFYASSQTLQNLPSRTFAYPTDSNTSARHWEREQPGFSPSVQAWPPYHAFNRHGMNSQTTQLPLGTTAQSRAGSSPAGWYTPQYSDAAVNPSDAPSPNLGTVNADNNHLAADFKARKHPRDFFVVGKVFRALWSEPGDLPETQSDVASRAWTKNSYGEWVHTKVRWFVVVVERDRSCTAVPITSYGGQGMLKPGVRISDHAVIYSGKTTPMPSDIVAGGPAMQPHPIRVDPDSVDKMDPMSRIDFGKTYTIEHYAKVKSFGRVNRASLMHLSTQYQLVNFDNKSALPLQNNVSKSESPSRLPPRTPESSLYSQRASRALRDLIAAGWSHEEAEGIIRPPPQGEAGRQYGGGDRHCGSNSVAGASLGVER